MSCKRDFYVFYKKISFLKSIDIEIDGVIHGDIFKDNTVFQNYKIGVFDFIDGGEGSFAFDIAVALVGFDVDKKYRYFSHIFLKTYNQTAPKKILQKKLDENIKIAKAFYALKRVQRYNNTTKARELI